MRIPAASRSAVAIRLSHLATSRSSSNARRPRHSAEACSTLRRNPASIQIRRYHGIRHGVELQGCERRWVGAFGTEKEEGQLSDAAPDTEASLDRFLSWAAANGVDGMGGDGAMVGIFCGDEGERGLAALQDVPPGQELLRIPLRIALTDHPDDEESNSMLYKDAPWSVRLAAKILREKRKGAESPWKAYLDVLPSYVPSPLTAFEWEEMQEIQYSPATEDVYEADWLAADAYKRCPAKAIGNASEEEFRWAMSVVHSRTFGSAAKQGGVGVRMLVPLVDMINHSGDWGGVINSTPGAAASKQGAAAEPAVTPLDVAAWELQTPEATSSGEWEMVVKAIRPMEEGQEVVMSYGERDNDDFLVHYGFVPEANPHDSVLLFSGAFDAVDWGLSRILSAEDGADKAQALGEEAMAAAEKAEKQQAGDDAQAAGPELRLLSGGRVDVRLLEAFKSLAHGSAGATSTPGESTDRTAARLVSSRCWEALGNMATTLEDDLEALGSGACSHGNTELFRFLAQKHKREAKEFVESGGHMPLCSASGSSSTADDSTLEADGDVVASGKQDGATNKPLSPSASVALQFRMYKKLLLWEAMVLLGPPLPAAGSTVSAESC